MRLTALCFCGTLLALSLSWTTADAGEGDLLGGKGFGPCAATLRPAVPCGQEQDDSTCPYIFSLPPLTVHLPKQLRDLEKIMKDLQKLKDNVDQLRKMCEDCKVSQNERACGRQGEREYEMLIEAKHEHKNERNWMNERNPERLQENDRDLRQECGMDRVKVEKIMEGDDDVEKRMNLEENWEAEKESDKGIIKEKSPKEVAEKDGKNQVEGTEGEDKLWKSKVPVASENERAGVREMVVNINNKETDRDKEKDGKGHSNGERRDNLENRRERKITINVKNKVKTEESDHDVWRDQTKETEKKTPTKEDRGRDQIKMSEDHDGHTNREQEQSGEERKKEMEKRIKVERNNEKPKQTESTGRAEKETTIKEGEMEEDTEKGKEIKTEEEKTVHSVQRDRDGELASSKAIERTDFVSISPTPQSIITLTQRPDFTDPDKAITITSSLPSPRLSSSTSHFIKDVYEESTVTAYGLPTPTTDFWTAGITELPDTKSDFGDSRPAITATKIPSAGASSQGGVSSTTATSNTTNPHQNLNTTTFPGPAHHQNISSNTNTGVQSVAGQKQITSKYDHKPDQAPLPEKTPKDDQKHKPSPQKSTADQTSRPGKESKQVQRPDQNLKNNTVPKHGRDRTTDENLENHQIREYGQNRTTGPSQVTTQKQSSHQKPNPPVQRPSSHQRPATVNTTSSDKEPESKEITIFNQNSKPVLPFKTTKPDQEQKPDIKSRSKEKTKPDQRSKLNQDRTSVQDPQTGRSQTNSHTTKPNQKFVTELMEHFDQNPSEPKSVKDPMSGQKPKNQKIPQMNQKPKPVQLPKFNRNHPKLVTDQKTKPNVKPKQNQGLQTNKVPRPTQIPNLNSKSVIDQISSTASNKTTKQWPLPRLRPPSRPALQPGATPAQTPKLAVQSKPSRKAKTHIDPPQISRTITDKIQNSHTDIPPTSPPVKQTAEMSHFPEDTEFSPSTMKTTDENLENDQISEHGQDRTTGPSQLTTQKQSSHQKPNSPVQRPSSHQRPATVNTTSSDKEPESKEITIFNQNSKPVLPFKTTKPDQEQKPDIKSRSKEKTKPDQRSKLNQDRTSVQDPQTGRSQTISHTTKPNQRFVTQLMEHFDQNPSEPKSVKDPMSGQKPKSSQKIPQTKKVPRPTQIPNLNSKSVIDQISSAASNKTTKQWPLPRLRPPSRPALQPGATPAQTPKLAVQSKPSRKAKTHIDPPQISRTITDKIQNSHTDIPPTSPPVKQTAEMSHSPEDTEFSPSTMKTISPNPKASNSLEAAPFPYLQALPKGYTMIPDSRIVSDLRPQTPGQPSAIPITSKPNKGIHGILPTVIPSANPGFTKPNPASNGDTTLQTEILHHVEEKATSKMMTSVYSPSAEPTSTVSAGFRSTTPASSGPEAPAAESSTSSARELRVKIKQMAALPKNSLSPQGRPSDKRLKEHPEDSPGASTPSTVIPSEVTIARRDCSDLLLLGETKSGVYLVTPDLHSSSFAVFCDMEHSGGGWTVLQRRQDGSVSFNRTWAEYRAGFGELDGGEFWLGNDMIHLLTWNRDMMLFVELEDFDGVIEYAQYDQFRVASERMRYRLTVKGYSGTAGDALRYSRSYDHNNRAFTTPDRDHDRYPSGNCGAYYSSGWWFDACLSANLNGKYYVRSYKGIRDGIFWGTWHNILTEHYPTNDRQAFKTVRMMIRPKGFTS